MRLLITGASGLLGLNLSLVATAQGQTVTGLVNSRLLQGVPFDVDQVDLQAGDGALAVIESAEPDAIIHCAAIADLNLAENKPELAWQLNANVPGVLASAAYRWGVPFVHISTDAVFDGRRGDYVEEDKPNPLSVYARSKLAGEAAVQEVNPDALITRVVFFGWSLSGKRSLSEFFFNNLKAGNQIQGFTDNLFCPLYVEDLAESLLEMLNAGLSGVYHVVSPEHLSKYDFGVQIAQRFGFDADLIKPIERKAVGRGAQRALNLALKPDKVQAVLGHRLPSVEAGIDRLYQRWQEGYPGHLQSFTV